MDGGGRIVVSRWTVTSGMCIPADSVVVLIACWVSVNIRPLSWELALSARE